MELIDDYDHPCMSSVHSCVLSYIGVLMYFIVLCAFTFFVVSVVAS